MENILKIESLLRASRSFHVVEDSFNGNEIIITSLTGQAVALSYARSTDEIVLHYYLILQPGYVSLYTYGRLAEMSGKLGLTLQAPAPTELRTCKIGMQKRVHFSLMQTLQEVESNINIFCFAVDNATSYFKKVAEAHEMPNVDVSMWDGVDLNFTNIDRLVERCATAYKDWSDLAETVSELDIPEELKEGMIDIANRCQLFEEANPHLRLAEVVDPLLALLEEIDDRPPPKNYDVN